MKNYLRGIFIGAFSLTSISTVWGMMEESSANQMRVFSQIKLKSQVEVKQSEIKSLQLNSQMMKYGTRNGIETIQKKLQYISGVPVFGSRIIDHYIQDKHIARFSKIISQQNISSFPLVSKKTAKNIAKEKNGITNSKVSLVIYPKEEQGILAWKVEEEAFDSRKTMFINANNSSIIDSFNALTTNNVSMSGHDSSGTRRSLKGLYKNGLYQLIDSDYNITTYEFSQGLSLPGEVVESQDNYVELTAAVDAHYFTNKIVSVLASKFNRRSFDNQFSKIQSTVQYVQGQDSYINAYWNGKQLVYGKGDNKQAKDLSGALDVIAHEFAHAITEKTSELIYYSESGALNEAFSDIMGTYFEYKIQPDSFDWKLGEDVWTPGVEGDALRYMNDPTKDGRSTDHYSTRYTGYQDNRGVHINSGIVNLAFYLLSEGGEHPNRDDRFYVEGIGIEKAVEIFYDGFTEFLSPSATFKDARTATVYVASLESPDLAWKVHQAWKAVGVMGKEPERDNTEESEEESNQVEVLRNNETLSIPDKSTIGVSSHIVVEDNTSEFRVKIKVQHTYISDLYIRLLSPKGKIYRLHNREGSNSKNIDKEYSVKLLSSDTSKGKWTLMVSDHARWDNGSLESWSISYMK